MDYEKKYKEALNKAKDLYGKYCINNVLEFIFPELRDERIKNEIISFLKEFNKDHYREIDCVYSWIEWLEKKK